MRYVMHHIFISNDIIFITGGYTGENQALADVLDYDPEKGKWTKVGQLANGRTSHGVSLVPKETAYYCV